MEAAAAIEIAIVEDDVDCRRALVEAIAGSDDMHLVWQAASLEDAMRSLAVPLDVLLIDLGLPDGSGLDLIGRMRQVQPGCAVMVSTMFGDDDHLFAAVRAGALGYLLKDIPAAEVLNEIRSLHAGGSPINPMMARKLLRQQGVEAAGAPIPPAPEDAPSKQSTRDMAGFHLSPRETQVLQLVSQGYILDEVASTMGITRHTVRSFVRRIYQKLQVGNRMEAVQMAIRHGLL